MPDVVCLSTAHTHSRGVLKAIAKHEDCKLVAIWDDQQDRGQNFADEFGAAYSADLEATIGRSDVDGFVICSENTRHLPLLTATIPRGKPIFCEKPFTTTAADAVSALKLIREHKTIVHMGYFQPFSAQMRGVLDLVASGALGHITHARFRNAHNAAYGRAFDSPEVAWFTDPKLAGGGAFMDMGTHAVHMLRTLLGKAEKAFAVISNRSGIYPDVDDNGIALVQFENDCLATIEASWVHTGGPDGLEIIGSEAAIFKHPQDGYVVAAPGKDQKPIVPGAGRPSGINRLVAVMKGELDADELEQDLICAVDAVAIMQACYQSSETGSWVDVPAMS